MYEPPDDTDGGEEAVWFAPPFGAATLPPDLARWNNSLTVALRYFLREVCDDDIVNRVRALILQTEEPSQLSWRTIKVKCLSNFLRPRSTKCIEDFATALREDRVSLSAWVSGIVILQSRLLNAGVRIPEDMLVATLWEQMSPREKELFGDIPTGGATFQATLERVSSATRIMPVYRKSDCAAAIVERPVPRVASKSNTKASAGDSTKKKNSGGHAWEPACAVCGKTNHPTAKCWRGTDGKNNDKKDGKNSASSRPVAFATVVEDAWTRHNKDVAEFMAEAEKERVKRYGARNNEVFLVNFDTTSPWV